MYFPVFFWTLVVLGPLSRGDDDSELDAYEKAKRDYCVSSSESWQKIDDMLNCYISAFHFISASDTDRVHRIVKDCEVDTFVNVTDAKQAFCAEEGFRTINEFNSCVNERLKLSDPKYRVDNSTEPAKLGKEFMIKVYKCLTMALEDNLTTVVPLTTTSKDDIVQTDFFSISTTERGPSDISEEITNDEKTLLSTPNVLVERSTIEPETSTTFTLRGRVLKPTMKGNQTK